MIDMHCHIIPGIDDGSKTVSMSVNMAKEALQHGYTGIFATSHFIQTDHETAKKDIEISVYVLNKLLKEKGIDIEIYTGNEVYFTPDIVEILKNNDKICTLNNTKYFLMEFPMRGTVMNFTKIIADITKKGYRPIIAHPERYEFSLKNLDLLKQAIEFGALLQINATSITGEYGEGPKKCVIQLLKNNMVHLVGTDSHNDTKIYENLDKSIKKISKIIGKEKLNDITCINPEKVKDGINIDSMFWD